MQELFSFCACFHHVFFSPKKKRNQLNIVPFLSRSMLPFNPSEFLHRIESLKLSFTSPMALQLLINGSFKSLAQTANNIIKSIWMVINLNFNPCANWSWITQAWIRSQSSLLENIAIFSRLYYLLGATWIAKVLSIYFVEHFIYFIFSAGLFFMLFICFVFLYLIIFFLLFQYLSIQFFQIITHTAFQ